MEVVLVTMPARNFCVKQKELGETQRGEAEKEDVLVERTEIGEQQGRETGDFVEVPAEKMLVSVPAVVEAVVEERKSQAAVHEGVEEEEEVMNVDVVEDELVKSDVLHLLDVENVVEEVKEKGGGLQKMQMSSSCSTLIDLLKVALDETPDEEQVVQQVMRILRSRGESASPGKARALGHALGAVSQTAVTASQPTSDNDSFGLSPSICSSSAELSELVEDDSHTSPNPAPRSTSKPPLSPNTRTPTIRSPSPGRRVWRGSKRKQMLAAKSSPANSLANSVATPQDLAELERFERSASAATVASFADQALHDMSWLTAVLFIIMLFCATKLTGLSPESTVIVAQLVALWIAMMVSLFAVHILDKCVTRAFRPRRVGGVRRQIQLDQE